MFGRLAIPLLLFLAPRLLPHIIRFIRLVWRLTFDKRVSIFLRLLLPAAILYMMLPRNIIPNGVPILGRFDDLIFFALALLLLIKLSPSDVVEEHKGNVRPSDRPEDKNPDKVVDGESRLIDDE